MESLDLTNKVAVITGASSGVGQATAVLFARRGASVVLCGRDQERLENVVRECVEASGGQTDRFISVSGDVNDAKHRQEIVDKTIQKFGKLDILVPNAGIVPANMGIRNTTEETFDNTFNTNVKSIFFLIQAALPELEKSKGNIIITSSILSTTVMRDGLTYTTTKATLDHMARSLSLDLAPAGIRVNTVNPSYVPTRITRDMFSSNPDARESFDKFHAASTPLHGRNVTPEAVAELMAFLASDAAMFITGQNHVIDSGRHFVFNSI